MAAQRDIEETELTLTTETLCANNCGLDGNLATNNMCQACFRDKIRPSTSGSVPYKARSDPIRPVQEESTKSEEGADVRKVVLAGKRAVNRCLKCGKRVGLTGFRCRCGDLFCGDHRYSDRHGCGFDYKKDGRERIQEGESGRQSC